jgi:hypothetical protein
MPDRMQFEAELERARRQAPPEIRKFVEWIAGELTDKLTRDFLSFGLPPMQARREAERAARILNRRVIGIVRAFHQWGV